MHDVIIVGLGAMGSAAANQLTVRGLRVLGIDRFVPPHENGSSHGQTRIIREAYFEDPAYVPLVRRAYELWEELQAETRRPLIRQTGGLMIGPVNGVVVQGARRSAREHRLPHENLSADEVRRRFPMLHPPDGFEAVWEPRAGVLFPETCVAANLEVARARGLTMRTGRRVARWEADSDGVRVFTDTDVHPCRHLLLTAGAWMNGLLPGWDPPLSIERQVQFWFDGAGDPALFHPDRCPVHLWEHQPGRFFYGFPDFGQGIKAAVHHEGQAADPDSFDRTVRKQETLDMRRLLETYVPAAAGSLRMTSVCLYTNTPDGHFLIDWHPASPRVLVASPCSGHGFKFSAAIGEVLADLLVEGRCRFDLGLFQSRRFQDQSTS